MGEGMLYLSLLFLCGCATNGKQGNLLPTGELRLQPSRETTQNH